jgi:flagellar hook assembly protein FlgD
VGNNVPTDFSLAQNYPNPFNPSTTIRFGLPKEAPVTLEIYNLLGMKVRTLISGRTMSAAYFNVVWDGKDDAGVGVPTGIYIYRIVADKFVTSKKMALIK